jgi:hypothetical protein
MRFISAINPLTGLPMNPAAMGASFAPTVTSQETLQKKKDPIANIDNALMKESESMNE